MIAASHNSRRVGLNIDGVEAVLMRTRSIHTLTMSGPIRVTEIDDDGRVLRSRFVDPHRIVTFPNRRWILETGADHTAPISGKPVRLYHRVTMPGTLTLLGTPIGNLSDLSARAVETLSNADLIFAEDTRRTAHLLAHIGVSVPMKSFFVGNERSRVELLRRELERGKSVVLVSDAGMPVVSDPGASAVTVAVDVGADVAVVPGPSAVLAALALSGFNGDRFVFEGFLARKGKERKAAIAAIAVEARTTVLFAAPSRIARDLADLADLAGPDRRVVVARELTKRYEEVWRGTLDEAAAHWATDGTTKGEFTVVLEGTVAEEGSLEDAADATRALIAQGSSTSDAVRSVADTYGVRRRELYERVLESRD